ncbi:hypothetical protein [Salipiger abyssi]|uniref:hypothetical protein n=1 Tax=Salipiger abyssi TaxID=1250539 RepID=UPI001A8E966E|nr:hypothetical protein [Salipiger abyssi]MBN9890125.1 hypothetical protein [Salipiger abyssi]
MRALLLLFLAGFLALAALPQSGMAMSVSGKGIAAHHAHDCDGCQGGAAEHMAGSACLHMAGCATATLPGTGIAGLAIRTVAGGFPLPAAEIRAATAPPCDLPPPRL